MYKLAMVTAKKMAVRLKQPEYSEGNGMTKFGNLKIGRLVPAKEGKEFEVSGISWR